jgi:hypothetical protein
MTKYRSAVISLGIVGLGVCILSVITQPYSRRPIEWALFLYLIPLAFSWLTFFIHRDKLISQRLQIWCTALLVGVAVALRIGAVYVLGDQYIMP